MLTGLHPGEYDVLLESGGYGLACFPVEDSPESRSPTFWVRALASYPKGRLSPSATTGVTMTMTVVFDTEVTAVGDSYSYSNCVY